MSVSPTRSGVFHDRRALVFTGSDASRVLEDPGEISDLLQRDDTFVWFDLAEPNDDDLALLQAEFNLHPMAIEDAALLHERPKIQAYEGYWLVVAHGASLQRDGALQLHEIAVFAGSNFLVTIRNAPLLPLAEIERRWLGKGTAVPHDAIGLLYVILDTIVDGYYPVATSFDERLVLLENRIFSMEEHPEALLRTLLDTKRQLATFRHTVAPLREIVAHVLRGDLAPIERRAIAYYRDVEDHAVRVLEQIDADREVLNGAMDIHLSLQTHRQNEVSKQLTVIATIFLPLTFITGFFGQNFGWMTDRLKEGVQFWWLGVGAQLVTLVILVVYFRRKRWF